MENKNNLIGVSFGRLTVLEYVEGSNCKCKCSCNKIIIVNTSNLVTGNSKSCGCLRKELTSLRTRKHGDSHTVLYNTWIRIKDRCYNQNNPDYKDYGGRGITVCDRWKESYENFKEDMSDIPCSKETRYSIDRKNVNGNYEPNNCRWATDDEQANNRRNSHYLTLRDKTLTITQWSKETNIPRMTIRNRLLLGWSIEDTLTIPPKKILIIEFNNQSHTISEWSKITGIKKNTIQSRLNRGWSIEKTLTTLNKDD